MVVIATPGCPTTASAGQMLSEITPKLLCFLSEITRNCLMDENSVALRSKYIADGNLLLKLRYFWEEHFLT